MRQPKREQAYYMTEPSNNGVSWSWFVTVDGDLVDVLYAVDGANALPISSSYLIHVDPRYNYQDVWLAMDAALEAAARDLDVADTWGGAIDAALSEGGEG